MRTLITGLCLSLALLGIEKASGLMDGASSLNNWFRFSTGAMVGMYLSFGIFRAIKFEGEVMK